MIAERELRVVLTADHLKVIDSRLGQRDRELLTTFNPVRLTGPSADAVRAAVAALIEKALEG